MPPKKRQLNLTVSPLKGSRSVDSAPKKQRRPTLLSLTPTPKRKIIKEKDKLRELQILEFHQNEQAHHSKLLKFASVNKLLHHLQLGISSSKEFLDFPEPAIINLIFNLLMLSPYNSPDMDSKLNDNGEYSLIPLNLQAFTYLNDLLDKTMKKVDNQHLADEEVTALQEMFDSIFKFISVKHTGFSKSRIIMRKKSFKEFTCGTSMRADDHPSKKHNIDKAIEVEPKKKKSKLENTDLDETDDRDFDISSLDKSSGELLFGESDFFGNKPLLKANIGPWNIFRWYFKCVHFRDQDLYRLNVNIYSKLVHLILRFYDWEFTNIEHQTTGRSSPPDIIKELLDSTMFYNNYKSLFRFSTSRALECFLDIVLGPIESFDNASPNLENDNKIVKGSILLNTLIDDAENDQTTLCLPTIPVRKALLFLHNRYLLIGDNQIGIERLVVSMAKRMQDMNYYDLIELFHCSIDDTVFMTQIDLLLPVSCQLMANITADETFVSDFWTIQDSETISKRYLELITSSHIEEIQIRKFKFLINFQVSIWMDYNWDTLSPEQKKSNKHALLKALKQVDTKYPSDFNVLPLFTLKMFKTI